MSLSTSRFAYNDIFDILERATEAKNGIRLCFASHDAAIHFRMRLNQARSIDREENLKLYKEGDPLYGRSVYDHFTTRIITSNDSPPWLYITPQPGPQTVEEIPDEGT